jgi:hypothetical protein
MEVLLGPPLPCSCSPIAISLPDIVVAAAIFLRDVAEQQGTETTCRRLLSTLQQAEQVGDLVAVLGGHAKVQPVQKLEEAPLYFSLESVMVDSVLNPVTGVLQVWGLGYWNFRSSDQCRYNG